MKKWNSLEIILPTSIDDTGHCHHLTSPLFYYFDHFCDGRSLGDDILREDYFFSEKSLLTEIMSLEIHRITIFFCIDAL